MNYTISIQINKNGWLTGQCEQIPEAITEGENMDNLMKNMYEAITEALEIRKDEFLANHKNMDCIHKDLYFPNETKFITETPQSERLYT